MSDKKRIDLQKHVSPKVSRRYIIRFGIYALLVAGLLVVIYFMRDSKSEAKTDTDYESVEEIRNFTIDTTESGK
ncbi:MAG: hypothetical protein Crog4KO_30980 [Crocinitomicaceae bacterium]